MYMKSDDPAVGHRIGNVSDLPEELQQQLASYKLDDTERKILKVMKDSFEGIANLDETIVGLYRVYGEIHERKTVNGKLYRMAKKDLVESVSGRKGVYKITK